MVILRFVLDALYFVLCAFRFVPRSGYAPKPGVASTLGEVGSSMMNRNAVPPFGRNPFRVDWVKLFLPRVVQSGNPGL